MILYSFVFDIHIHIHIHIHMIDTEALLQMVSNAALNALKYTIDGEVKLLSGRQVYLYRARTSIIAHKQH